MHEYYDFELFINFKGDVAKKPQTANFQPAFERFGEALLKVAVTVCLQRYIDVNYMKTDEFASRRILFKVLYLIVAFCVQVYTMCAGFASLDANMIASGLGYRAKSKTEPETFKAKMNVNMFNFQFSINGTDALSNFNMNANSWIKYYCMMRIMDRSRPKGAV